MNIFFRERVTKLRTLIVLSGRWFIYLKKKKRLRLRNLIAFNLVLLEKWFCMLRVEKTRLRYKVILNEYEMEDGRQSFN